MNKKTTDTHSGNKRPNVFLHYTAAASVLMLASSVIHPTDTAVYAASQSPMAPITAPSSETATGTTPEYSLSSILPTTNIKTTTLAEYSLQIQLAKAKDELAAKDSIVTQKVAEINAEFAKYENVDALITKLYSYVGKAPYVFSGIGPTGWDCSGLTSWFYHEYKGSFLEHRASVQAEGGTEVDNPIPGDIVAFTYKGSKHAYHVGIYVGGGFMIHAKNQHEGTVLENVALFAEKTSKVAYIRY